ncbi:hydrogenase maturation nickel metallochaperone HypA [Candidatus Woesearchaeota archaeon]|nr:hydrogenase maturation nickel metallochaperone HypA [Candidatus Woesearchaeota archaeon]
MHEQAIAQDIIAQAVAAAGGRPLKRVTVEVGEVAHLPASELRGVLAALLPGVEVVIEGKDARVSCACGFEGRPVLLEKGHDHNVFKCPACGAMMPRVLDGNDIVLVSIHVPN